MRLFFDGRKGGGPAPAKGTTSSRYRVPAAILLLGLLSIGFLFWVYRIGERERVNLQHIDAVKDIQVRTVIFHNRLDEALGKGNPDAASKSFRLLDEAIKLSRALIGGGETEQGSPMPALKDPRSRRQAESIAALLSELKEISSRRIAEMDPPSSGSQLNNLFESAIESIQETTRTFELQGELVQAEDDSRTKNLLLAVFIAWGAIVAAAAFGLHANESRRLKAEKALENANDEMKNKALDWSAELTEANRQLEEEISERSRTEESLRRSQEGFKALSLQLRTLLDTIPDRITLVSRDLKVLWANRDRNSLSHPEDREGESCFKLWHDRSYRCEQCPAAAAFRSGKAENARISTPDGRQWDMRAVPVKGPDGAIESVLEVTTDITEKLAHETESMRAANLASVGELAAGVAHEINNPINGIINYAQILCNQSDSGSMQYEIAGGILEAGGRVSQIVSALLSLARERKEGKRPTHLAEIFSDSLLLTGSQMRREGIRVEMDIPPDLPDVMANPNQVQQVVMNLINNARYALNQKYHGAHENKVLKIRAEKTNSGGSSSVRVIFNDRGTGIPAGIMERVMEPFFTTKPRGKGPGLGLSVCHGIVTDHGGRINIESVEGEFTTVVVELPALEEAIAENPRH